MPLLAPTRTQRIVLRVTFERARISRSPCPPDGCSRGQDLHRPSFRRRRRSSRWGCSNQRSPTMCLQPLFSEIRNRGSCPSGGVLFAGETEELSAARRCNLSTLLLTRMDAPTFGARVVSENRPNIDTSLRNEASCVRVDASVLLGLLCRETSYFLEFRCLPPNPDIARMSCN